jgi:hypothetical protein
LPKDFSYVIALRLGTGEVQRTAAFLDILQST